MGNRPGMPFEDYCRRQKIEHDEGRERIIAAYLEAIEYTSRGVTGAAIGVLQEDLRAMPDRHLRDAPREQTSSHRGSMLPPCPFPPDGPPGAADMGPGEDDELSRQAHP